MNRFLSTFLDFGRICAAVLVFIHHLEQLFPQAFKSKLLSVFASFGHDAVIFFFVLSGFVIGYVANTKETSLIDYALARAVRIYSVAAPAIVLTIVLALVGWALGYAPYVRVPEIPWGSVALSSLIFTNHTSLDTMALITNGPYWSICYEVWYYVIFAMWFYLRGYRRAVLLSLAVVCAGYEIVLLMPIWIAGYLLFKHHQQIPRHRLLGGALLLVSVVSYLGFRFWNLDDRVVAWSYQFCGGPEAANALLGFSKQYVADYITTVLLCGVFIAVFMLRLEIPTAAEPVVRAVVKASSFTFSLYLYHMPLLLFFAAATHRVIPTALGSLLVVYLLARLTEQQKTRVKTYVARFLKRFQRQPL